MEEDDEKLQDVVDVYGPHIGVLTMANTALYGAASDRSEQRLLNTLVECYLKSIEERYGLDRHRLVEAVQNQYAEYASAMTSRILSEITGQEIFVGTQEILEETGCESMEELIQKLEDGEVEIKIT